MEILLAAKHRQKRHIILIASVSFCFQFLLSYGAISGKYNIIFMAGLMPITLITTYTFVYKLIPKYVLNNKLIPFISWAVVTFLGSTIVTLSFLMIAVGYIPGLTMDEMPSVSKNYPFLLAAMFLIVIFVSFISLWKHRQLALVEKLNIEKKLAESEATMKRQELDFLKSQLHPHFLFNSLNTLYSLALTKSKETPEIILKLSGLLDYILYQVDQPSVSLKKEIDHISTYIDLEKTRFEDTLKVIFATSIDKTDYDIAPMLLMPFVENAFKHGKIIALEQSVKAKLTVAEDHLTFTLENTCIDKDFEQGLGLQNIEKRLALHYPNRHKLNISQEASMFKVILEIRGLKPVVND